MEKLTEETAKELGSYEKTSLPEYIEIVLREYEMEKEKKASFENRAGIIFGFVSALIIFLLDKVNIKEFFGDKLTPQVGLMLVLSVVALILTIGILVFLVIILTTKGHTAFNVASITDKALMRDKILEQSDIISSYVKIIIKIQELNEKKARYLNMVLWSSFVLTMLIGILVIIK